MKKFTLIDTMRDVEWDEIREHCEGNDIETLPKEGTKEYWGIVGHIKDWEWDDFIFNLKHCLENERFIITGTLGLWNGSHDIYATVKDGLYEAVMYCISESILDVDVHFNDGIIEVNCHHHDGTNCFEIHRLSYLGKKELDKEKYYWGEDIVVKPWMLGRIKETEIF